MLVSENNFIQRSEKSHNDGEALRALSTKLFVKANNGHVNSVGYSNNDKDWVIRG
jgi:hypothetical protein